MQMKLLKGKKLFFNTSNNSWKYVLYTYAPDSAINTVQILTHLFSNFVR